MKLSDYIISEGVFKKLSGLIKSKKDTDGKPTAIPQDVTKNAKKTISNGGKYLINTLKEKMPKLFLTGKLGGLECTVSLQDNTYYENSNAFVCVNIGRFNTDKDDIKQWALILTIETDQTSIYFNDTFYYEGNSDEDEEDDTSYLLFQADSDKITEENKDRILNIYDNNVKKVYNDNKYQQLLHNIMNDFLTFLFKEK